VIADYIAESWMMALAQWGKAEYTPTLRLSLRVENMRK
jgi:hypothetical protein